MRNLIAVVVVALVSCGRADVSNNLEPVGTIQQSLGPCGVEGQYWGTGTVTQNLGGGDRCSAMQPGDVSQNIGVEFDDAGTYVRWLGAGFVTPACTTTYAGCSIQLDCNYSGGPFGDFALTWNLNFDASDAGDSATGHYTMNGTGSYCTDFELDLSFAR